MFNFKKFKNAEKLEITATLALLTAKLLLCARFTGIDFNPFVIMLNAGLFLLLIPWTAFLPAIPRRCCLFLLNLFCSLLFWADLLNYRFFGLPLTSYAFQQVANLSGLGPSIFSLFEVRDLLLFADLPWWPVLIFPGSRARQEEQNGSKGCKGFVLAGLALGIVLTSIYPVQQVYLRDNNIFRRFDTAKTFRNFGPLGFHFIDTACFIRDRNIRLTEERENLILSWFDLKNRSDKPVSASPLYGICKGKNLIVIQVESLQNFVIGRTVEGQPITPNLNKLLANSLYYRHFYPQTVDGNSSDAELTVNTSLYPLRQGSTFFSYPGNSYGSLPLLLRNQGYYSLAIHADEANYWNRHLVYPQLGFHQFNDISKFNNDEEIGMGLSDMSMFEQSIRMLEELPRPFFAFLITLTSHFPYDLPADKRLLKLSVPLEGAHLGNYLQAVRYTDEAIGLFLAQLKEKGLLKDSLVVIYGDHDGLFERDKPELERLWAHGAIDQEEWVREFLPVPLIIYQPGFKGQKPDVYGGQVDVLPTLACLLGFKEEDTRYAMGRNLLTAKDGGFALIPKGDYIQQAAYVTRDSIKDTLDEEERQSLLVADLIIRTDFFNKFKKAIAPLPGEKDAG